MPLPKGSPEFRIALARLENDPGGVVKLLMSEGWTVEDIVLESVKFVSRDYVARRGMAEYLAPHLGITVPHFMRIADVRN